MNNYGELIDNNTIKFSRLLPGPIERVWLYLTDSDKRETWLAAGKTEQAIGGVVELKFHNASLSTSTDEPPAEKYRDMPEHVSFEGTVTQIDPPHLLSYNWPGETPEEESEVSFQLEQQGDKVLLTVIHRRIYKRSDLLGATAGWHTHLDILDDVLNNRPTKPFWTAHNALEEEYEKRI